MILCGAFLITPGTWCLFTRDDNDNDDGGDGDGDDGNDDDGIH